MTLYEYLKQTSDCETTIWDKDYDMETYFYKGNDDNWDKAMNEFAKLLTVMEISKEGVTVNMYDVIEKAIPSLKKADLFIKCNVDAIMEDMDLILAGNVSEEWFCEFVEVLKKCKEYTFSQLVTAMQRSGCNLAEVAIGRMMTVIEEQTGKFPDWQDIAPDWVVENCLGR